MANHIPLVLPCQNWPEDDRTLWDSLFVEAGFLEEAGAGASWSDGTRSMYRQAYGQWLSFLLRHDPPAVCLQPAARISLERVEAYLGEASARLNRCSVSNLVAALSRIARAFDPDQDWAWLARAERRLGQDARSRSVPPAKPITAERVSRASLARLEFLTSADHGLAPVAFGIEFRRALLMGFLIARPVRRRALCAMTVDSHLIPTSSGFRIRFPASDMKDKREHGFPLPATLVPAMRLYLTTARPALLDGRNSNALWVTSKGAGFTADGIAGEIETATSRLLGLKLNPHAFRHVAATSIAEMDPEHIGIIKDILGHATLAMAEKHYNRATGISGCNALQSIVEDIRSNVPKMARANRDRALPKRHPHNR